MWCKRDSARREIYHHHIIIKMRQRTFFNVLYLARRKTTSRETGLESRGNTDKIRVDELSLMNKWYIAKHKWIWALWAICLLYFFKLQSKTVFIWCAMVMMWWWEESDQVGMCKSTTKWWRLQNRIEQRDANTHTHRIFLIEGTFKKKMARQCKAEKDKDGMHNKIIILSRNQRTL